MHIKHIKGPVAETCPRVKGNVAGTFFRNKIGTCTHDKMDQWPLAGHVPFVWSDTFSSCNTSCFRIIRIRIISWYTKIWRTIRRTLQIIHYKKSTVSLRPQIAKATRGGRSYSPWCTLYSVLCTLLNFLMCRYVLILSLVHVSTVCLV